MAGISVSVVADELVLALPDHSSNARIVTMLGGSALYPISVGGLKLVSNDRPWPPLSHISELALLAALAVPAFAHLLSALALVSLACSFLVIVAAWDQCLYGSTPTRHRHMRVEPFRSGGVLGHSAKTRRANKAG